MLLGKNTNNAFNSAGIKLVSEIKITGITFGYDQDKVDDLNFNPILFKMARRFNEWRGRNLSVLGKVLVSKALGMSQLIFTASLTMVPDWVIKQATTLIYKFIWGGPDKITRELACKDYEEGGLRAPNIRLLIDALHGTWIIRYCKPGYHGWKTFMDVELRKLNCDISCLTGNFQPAINTKNYKPLNVLSHAIQVWGRVTSSADKQDINQILTSSIWMNGDIMTREHKPLCNNLRSNNVHIIKDLLNPNGKLATFEELINKGWHHGDYISWISILSCIPKSWKKQINHNVNLRGNAVGRPPQININTTGLVVGHPLVVEQNLNSNGQGQFTNVVRNAVGRPHSPTNGAGSRPESATTVADGNPVVVPGDTHNGQLFYLFNELKATPINKLKCKNIYTILLKQLKHKTPPFRSRVTDQYQLNDDNWKVIFTIPHTLTVSTKLRAFHWRLTHGLLYGNKQLHKFGIKDDSNCNLCTTPLQSWQHLMTECSTTRTFWDMIEAEFANIFDARITNLEKEIGSINEDDDMYIQKNLLLLIVRQYIYHCNLDDISPTIVGLISKVRFYERIEYDIASRKDSIDKHFAKWEEILHCLSIGTPII